MTFDTMHDIIRLLLSPATRTQTQPVIRENSYPTFYQKYSLNWLVIWLVKRLVNRLLNRLLNWLLNRLVNRLPKSHTGQLLVILTQTSSSE